jgi:hypothetical protein
MAMLCGVVLINFIVYGHPNEGAPPLSPCPNLDWRFVVSSLVVLSLAIAIVETLNWVGWFITRDQALPIELEQLGGGLFIPSGWFGPVFVFGLLVVAYVLRRPNLCEPLDFTVMTWRDLVSTLTLAYAFLIMSEAIFGGNRKGARWKPE